MFDVRSFEAKIQVFEFDHQRINTFEFVRCSKNDVRVRSMFDKMVFDPSLLIRKLQSSCWKMFTWVKYERPNWQMIAKYSSILGKSTPFRLGVHLDSLEVTNGGAAITSEVHSSPSGSIGFKLFYFQKTC